MSQERRHFEQAQQRGSSSAVPVTYGGVPRHSSENNPYYVTANPGPGVINNDRDPYHSSKKSNPFVQGQHRSISAANYHKHEHTVPTHHHGQPPIADQVQPPTSKEIYEYNAPWPVYALDWCRAPNEQRGFRMAIGSIIEDSQNKMQVIARTDVTESAAAPSGTHRVPDFTVSAEIDVHYPITKLIWEPWKGDTRPSDLLATTSDILRLWEVVDHPHYGTTTNSINSSRGRKSPTYYTQQLVKKAEFINTKKSEFYAPLTSFDWNEADPSLVVTSSIDTTCTVWNIETNQPKTQLIAHDSDVYDVAFMRGSRNIFASVGADGSVRLFDLRSLEHSIILYEAPQVQMSVQHDKQAVPSTGTLPLLRLEFNPKNINLLATFQMDSSSVQILDVRYPSIPVVELVKAHHGSINGISWSSAHPGQLCTGGDGGQVLVWDINRCILVNDHSRQANNQQRHYTQHQTQFVKDPLLSYTAESDVSSLSWSKGVKDWIGISFDRTVQALHV